MILAGKDKGKTGIIEKAFPDEGKIVVKGIALAKKHVKPTNKNPRGGIMDINLKINASNAIIVCPACGKPTKVSHKKTEFGKIRICKKCDQSLEAKAA